MAWKNKIREESKIHRFWSKILLLKLPLLKNEYYKRCSQNILYVLFHTDIPCLVKIKLTSI